jgi:AbrB family looped-hinge helix DNA binding protein
LRPPNGASTRQDEPDLRAKNPKVDRIELASTVSLDCLFLLMVAGVGFEPTTFGLGAGFGDIKGLLNQPLAALANPYPRHIKAQSRHTQPYFGTNWAQPREQVPRLGKPAKQVMVSLHFALRNRDRSEIRMSTITVSSKYQIVIPSKIREALGIKPGEKLHAIEYRGRIELVPVRPIKAARGSLKGIDTSVPRDADRV